MSKNRLKAARFGKVLLSPDGEEYQKADGSIINYGTTTWCDPDYPSWDCAKACEIADNAIKKICGISETKSRYP
ncbi:hypothetical protein [Vibrio sp. Hal054]|uniref:hypothetical protein n=1 Tax=Vibrio sp. Hal054 TaxID=3035158 RepID=UPI00301BC408